MNQKNNTVYCAKKIMDRNYNVIVSKSDGMYFLDVLGTTEKGRQLITKKISKSEAMTICRTFEIQLNDIDNLRKPEINFQNK